MKTAMRLSTPMSVIKSTEYSGSGKKLERLHAAQNWMRRVFACTSHLSIKLSIALTAWNA